MDLLIDLQTWLRNSMAAQLSAASGAGDSLSMALALASAVLFGFVHAFTPGHGKTLLVSYFLGSGGSLWRGFATAAILALTHVVSAIVLVLAGLGLLQKTLGGAVLRLLERLGDWPRRVSRGLEIFSALAVVLFGLFLAINA